MGNVYAMMTTTEVTAQVNLDFLLFYWSNITLKIWFYCIKFFIQCHSFFAFFHPVACEAATNCNGHGTCRGNDTCECDSHFFGADCTSKILIILRFRGRFSYHSRALKSGSELRAALAILSLS